MKQNLTEIKRLQNLAGIKKINLTEEDQPEKGKETSSVPPEVSAAASVFDLKAVKDQAKEKAQKLDEVLDPLTWLGIIMAIPALLQGLATIMEKAKRKFSNLSKEEIEKIKAHNLAVAKGEIEGHKKYASEVSKEVDQFAHWLHSIMVKPVEGVFWVLSKIPGIGKFLKDEKKRHKMAEAIYLLLAIGVGGYGLLSHAVGLTTAIDIAKLADVTVDSASLASTSGLIKNGPELILKLVA
jgi:hypothetical protein